ncbi:MAG: hypothetical protein HY901_13310 [Deltaproteobacteria bacterium]|nr:hypothetical protein [Deltaproteobacteria bacterium]
MVEAGGCNTSKVTASIEVWADKVGNGFDDRPVVGRSTQPTVKEHDMKTSIRTVVVATVLGLAFGTLGCAGALTEAGARVKLVKADPPAECAEVGGVSAYRIGPDYHDKLKNSLRNDAASKGANYVRLESLTSDGNAAGTAYRCPETPAAAPATDVAPKAP